MANYKNNQMSKSNFEIGDIVEVIDDSDFANRQSLRLGSYHTVRGFSRFGNVLLETIYNDKKGGDERGYSCARFKFFSKQINPVIKNEMNGFVVTCPKGEFPKLVQQLLFANGFEWVISKKEILSVFGETEAKVCFMVCINAVGILKDLKNRTIYSGAHDKLPSFDAKDDFAKIAELLSKIEPEKPKVSPPVINGYIGEYKNNGSGIVKFGCAQISVALLASVRESMDDKFKGNRTVESIKLNSGIEIAKSDIENIFKYIDFVNKNS